MHAARRQSPTLIPLVSRKVAIWVLSAVVLLAACSSGTPPKVIKIGVDLPLNGAAGRAGTPALNGVQFFVDRHPTLDGFTVQVVSLDDAAAGVDDPAQGEHNMTALADRKSVV